jgi:hypothetical protein
LLRTDRKQREEQEEKQRKTQKFFLVFDSDINVKRERSKKNFFMGKKFLHLLYNAMNAIDMRSFF